MTKPFIVSVSLLLLTVRIVRRLSLAVSGILNATAAPAAGVMLDISAAARVVDERTFAAWDGWGEWWRRAGLQHG